ncbi:DUF4917 family protein [Paenibacillus sp. JJ1722]|uniref:DUF4917 family protein n=1 Tax=Paenibacillus sp. JJ1722 TaxID=3398770 RepID=UPI003AAE2FC1
MEELKTFEKLIEQDDIYLTNLLFGNGFSINFGSKFMYSNLFEEAKQLFSGQDIELFGKLETTNFEYVLRILSSTIDTNLIYGIKHESLRESYERVKDALIETVRKVHPEPHELSFEQVNDLKTIFRIFKEKVFTTNYDLLAYWALNKVRGINRTVSDGFGYDADSDMIMFGAGPGVSKEDNPIRLYHLHGSLHFYMEDGDIIKITKSRNPVGLSELPLLNVITETYDSGYFPLYISEGTWKQKLNRVLNNKYLRFCYEALLKSSEGLTIYGQSLDRESDKHIIDAIKNSSVRKLAFGIYDVGNSANIIHEITEHFKDSSIEVEFFDARYFFESLRNIEMEMTFK